MAGQDPTDPTPAVRKLMDRRRLLQTAGAGAVVAVISGCSYTRAGDDKDAAARAEIRPDGKPRLPPGQYLLKALRPMGGDQGNPDPTAFRLKIYGEVSHPFELNYAGLLGEHPVEQQADVHCVTRWSMFDGLWKGVRIQHLAKLAGVKDSAQFVIFEAAYGYTSNVPLEYAMRANSMVTYRLNGDPFPEEHGAPVRALVPDLYFWKSAKWLTGIRFSAVDEPGYWERHGYNNHADPWKEERFG